MQSEDDAIHAEMVVKPGIINPPQKINEEAFS